MSSYFEARGLALEIMPTVTKDEGIGTVTVEFELPPGQEQPEGTVYCFYPAERMRIPMEWAGNGYRAVIEVSDLEKHGIPPGKKPIEYYLAE